MRSSLSREPRTGFGWGWRANIPDHPHYYALTALGCIAAIAAMGGICALVLALT